MGLSAAKGGWHEELVSGDQRMLNSGFGMRRKRPLVTSSVPCPQLHVPDENLARFFDAELKDP